MCPSLPCERCLTATTKGRWIIPKSLTDGVRTLTANIVLEMAYAADLHRQALIATGVVLFVFILIINLLFSILKQGGRLWKRN